MPWKKGKIKLLSLLFLAVFLLLFFPQPTLAAIKNCSGLFTITPGLIAQKNTITICGSEITSPDKEKYEIEFRIGGLFVANPSFSASNIDFDQHCVSFEVPPYFYIAKKYPATYKVVLNINNKHVCQKKEVTIGYGGCEWSLGQTPRIGEQTDVLVRPGSEEKKFVLKVTTPNNQDLARQHPQLATEKEIKFNFTPQEEGIYTLRLQKAGALRYVCDAQIKVSSQEEESGIIGTDTQPQGKDLGTYKVCQGNQDCQQCFDEGKAWTALGCIPTDPTELIKWVFPYLLGFGGLAAFLLIVFAGIQIMTSSGNPEKLKAGKELITSAITGLIFIILSLFLLRVIGVDILRIPGLE